MFISVDSAFPTRTKTSASKQNLSIQLSNSSVTSVPGLLRGRRSRVRGREDGIRVTSMFLPEMEFKYLQLRSEDILDLKPKVEVTVDQKPQVSGHSEPETTGQRSQ